MLLLTGAYTLTDTHTHAHTEQCSVRDGSEEQLKCVL